MLRGKEPANEQSYLTDAFGREAVSFIERHNGKPWFLYLAFNAVHTPMHADDARLKKFASIEDTQRRTYAAMMFAMDEAIGSIRKTIAEKGQTENTLVTFISDNESLPGQTKKGTSAVRLYNLRDDIGETQDLSASQPDIVKKLQSQWDLWNTNNIPPGSIAGGTKAEGGTKKRKQNEK